ncbi:MAG: asparagine synthase (glutamine-hydrolyzing) [Magnetococcales bacterium]|nr:asparagine synthase (glutamine-hydrolyzing) [Magnetococcales bacterium]
MCGIAGRFSWDPPPQISVLERMTRRLAHRGPDHGAVVLDGVIGLGHRRLAIIDLKPESNQPLRDVTDRLIIVFNGEIYNHQELRRELENLGANFATHSDTEVILEAWKIWGVACLQRFNGMFALALWDRTTKTLFLARDRLGKKPLYYHLLPRGGIVFGSELKALLADEEVPRKIDPDGLSQYLSLNYTLGATSMLAGVRKLKAGHFLLLDREGRIREESWWDLAHHFRNKLPITSEGEALEAWAALFRDAVRLRMISDVPLGAFLSGGVDSSAVTASMANLGNPAQLDTFSMDFPEEGFSELHKARRVANHLGVRHHERTLHRSFAANLANVSWYVDEPFADSSILPMFDLAAFARESVTVALSGDGADEIFGGYVTYDADRIHALTRWIPQGLMQPLGKAVTALLPVSMGKVGLDERIRRFLDAQDSPPAQAHVAWRQIFSREDKWKLLRDPWRRDVANHDLWHHFQPLFQQVADCHFLDQAMYVDIRTWLVDDILVKVDRATMAHALEARAPFLDYRVVEFAAALPVKFKIQGLQKKVLLKKSLAGRLPGDILQQKKAGFSAPVSRWFTCLTDPLVAGLRRNMPGEDLFDPRQVDTLWHLHAEKRQDNGLRLLNLVFFNLWLRRLQGPEAAWDAPEALA